MERDRKFRALVVDDNEEIRKLVTWMLSREDIVCEEAADGVTASNMVGARRYDVVITDLAMPRKHGHKLIVELMERESPPMIVVITGVTEARIIQDLFTRGVEDVFFKPLTRELFSAKVKALLVRRAERRQPVGTGNKAMNVAQSVGQATATLRSQLAEVQQSFKETISNLEDEQQKLEAGFLGSVRVLTNLVAQVGESQGSHPVRVERMSVALGTELGLSHAQLMDVKIAALLHEIGQIGLPDAMRAKAPWELDAKEREVYQKYPVIGSLLLSEVPGAEGVVSLVESHAENFDGTGFPNGYRESEISLSARILRISDGLDTFMMHTGVTAEVEKGIEHLYAEQGKKYDSSLVRPAVDYLRKSAQAEQNERIEEIPVSELESGHTIGENLYDEHGRLLVRKGVVVSEHVVEQLLHLIRFQTIKVIVTDGKGE